MQNNNCCSIQTIFSPKNHDFIYMFTLLQVALSLRSFFVFWFQGSARRKKKVVHRTATADDKKLQSSLKKLVVNNIAGIEEVQTFTFHNNPGSFPYFAARQTCLEIILSPLQVNMIKDDGTVIHFNNPKVQASLSANTFAITGHAETKQLTEMLPSILSQLGGDSLSSLRKLAEHFPRQGGCRSSERFVSVAVGVEKCVAS